MEMIPEKLKPLTAFIRRAEELDKDTANPDAQIIAYFCRKYAMEKGMKMKLNTPEINTFLFNLMDNLEKSKQTLNVSDEAGAVTCENYAHSVFSKYDEEDRAGNATKMTAKGFYTASTFFDILEQFGELDSEVQEKRKYAQWKATDILNAIKSGVKPTPGALGEDTLSTIAPALATVSPPPTTTTTTVSATNTETYHNIPAAPTAAPIIPLSSIPIAPYTMPPSATATSASHVTNSSNITTGNIHNTPSSRPITVSGIPVGNSAPISKPSLSTLDARVKDAMEYTSFALTALKVSKPTRMISCFPFLLLSFLWLLLFLVVILFLCLFFSLHGNPLFLIMLVNYSCYPLFLFNTH